MGVGRTSCRRANTRNMTGRSGYGTGPNCSAGLAHLRVWPSSRRLRGARLVHPGLGALLVALVVGGYPGLGDPTADHPERQVSLTTIMSDGAVHLDHLGPAGRSKSEVAVARASLSLSLGRPDSVPALGAAFPAPSDLPPQSGRVPPACATHYGRPGSWSVLVRQVLKGGLFFPPAFEVHVDPWRPCQLYMMPNAETLLASMDAGRTWRQVFHDDKTSSYAPGGSDPTCGRLPSALSCSLTSPPFTASGLYLPSPDRVVLSEAGNGDAAVASADGGRTWRLANGGIANQAVQRLFFAPSDPSVGYALIRRDDSGNESAQPSASSLYVTTDAGQSWTPALLPPAPPYVPPAPSVEAARDGLAPYDLAVDPANPRHIWVLYNTLGLAVSDFADPRPQISLLLESEDAGQHWTNEAILPFAQVDEIVVTRIHQRLRLYAAGRFSDYPSSVIVSDNDGVTWWASSVPRAYPDSTSTLADALASVIPEPAAAVAIDPGNPERVAATVRTDDASRPQVFFSQDGLKDVIPYLLPGVVSLYTPLTASHYGWAESLLQVDQYGNFYVTLNISQLALFGGSSYTGQEYLRLNRPA